MPTVGNYGRVHQVDAVEWALVHKAAHLANVDKERVALYEQGKSLQVLRARACQRHFFCKSVMRLVPVLAVAVAALLPLSPFGTS